MLRLESPFTYTSGRSILHRWSTSAGSYWWLRLATKVIVFFGLSVLSVRLTSWVSGWAALGVYLIVVSACVATLWTIADGAKARLLVREISYLAFYGVTLGWPLYVLSLLLRSAFGGGKDLVLGRSLATVVMMIGTVTATLSLAAVFLASTSLWVLVRWLPLSRKLRWLIAIVLAYLPRFGERLRGIAAALQSLGGSGDESASRRIRLWVLRFVRPFLAMGALVWEIVSVDGLRVYLMWSERSKEGE